MTPFPFQCHPDERPPQIDPHSKAKLWAYLRQYFERI